MTVTQADQHPTWPAGDPGKVLLNCVVSLNVDSVFEELFGSYSDTQVRWHAAAGGPSCRCAVCAATPCLLAWQGTGCCIQPAPVDRAAGCLLLKLLLQAKLHKQRSDTNCAESPWVSQRSQLPAQQFVWPAPPAGADPGTPAQGKFRKVRAGYRQTTAPCVMIALTSWT